MPAFTDRMGLYKPTDLEPMDVGLLNSNFDKLDASNGMIMVNPDVTPPDSQLFDGAIIKERVNGRIRVANKLSGGGFSFAYIKYPYSIVANGSGSIGSGSLTALQALNIKARVAGRGINGIDSDIHDTANAWQAPVTCTVSGYAVVNWGNGGGGTGRRVSDINCNNYAAGGYNQQIDYASNKGSGSFTQIIPFSVLRMNAGERLYVFGAQDSGNFVTYTVTLHVNIDIVWDVL